MAGDPIRVGIVLREEDLSAWSGRLPELAERAVASGIDHLTVGDHVSFADGRGADGRHALQLWVGFAGSRADARARLSAAMEAAYSLPFERFERYVPYGRPAAVAEALRPYLAAGCRRFNFVPEARCLAAALEAVAEVKTLLADGTPDGAAARS